MDDCRKCQTFAASPAEPGGLPLTLVSTLDLEAVDEMDLQRFDIIGLCYNDRIDLCVAAE